MSILKHKIEALLFSSGRAMTLEELRKLTRADSLDIRQCIEEIKAEMQTREISIVLEEDVPQSWKLAVRDQHLSLVRKIVSKTELKKSLLETLAIVAWKAPVLQSEIISMRTNKAYDDLKELEARNYISRQKQGRTKLIRLGQKFFEYFDIPADKVKEKFSRFSDMEHW